MISELQQNQIEQVLELMQEFGSHLADKELAYQIYVGHSLRQQCYICTLTSENGDVIGTGTIWYLHKVNNRMVAQIEDVVVRSDCRGKGYGHQIVEHLIDHASHRKAYKIILNCSEDNEAFYHKCGFHKNETQMRIDLSELTDRRKI